MSQYNYVYVCLDSSKIPPETYFSPGNIHLNFANWFTKTMGTWNRREVLFIVTSVLMSENLVTYLHQSCHILIKAKIPWYTAINIQFKQYQMQQLQKLHSITGLSPNSKFASKPQRGIITIYGLCLWLYPITILVHPFIFKTSKLFLIFVCNFLVFPVWKNEHPNSQFSLRCGNPVHYIHYFLDTQFSFSTNSTRSYNGGSAHQKSSRSECSKITRKSCS